MNFLKNMMRFIDVILAPFDYSLFPIVDCLALCTERKLCENIEKSAIGIIHNSQLLSTRQGKIRRI